MPRLPESTAASASARRTSGIPRLRAASKATLPSRTADEYTTQSAPATAPAECGHEKSSPTRAIRSVSTVLTLSDPLTR
jgi:hypothetical protein